MSDLNEQLPFKCRNGPMVITGLAGGFIMEVCDIVTVSRNNGTDCIFTCPLPAADIFLWRSKKITAGILGFVTAIWVLFELLEYHFLTLVCHLLILALAFVFLWSHTSALFKK